MEIIFALISILATSAAYFDYDLFGMKLNNQNTKASALSPSDVLFNGTYETPLDHFSPRDGRLLELKYQGNKGFFEKNRPIFINVNVGDGFRLLHSGLVYDLAKDIKGALVQANNRYFGLNMWGSVKIILQSIIHILLVSVCFQ